MPAELPTSTELQAIKNLKQITREEFILPGTAICGGCGGLEALQLAAKVLGPKKARDGIAISSSRHATLRLSRTSRHRSMRPGTSFDPPH